MQQPLASPGLPAIPACYNSKHRFGMRGTPVSRTSSACRLALLLGLLAACGHRGGKDNDSGPKTNIDLTVTQFAVTPSSSDPEDSLHLTGRIENIGSETANPMQGDSFLLRFNLSTDGTFEYREEGFVQKEITDPILPGAGFDFAYDAPYGGGDTQALFGNFCNSTDCVPPETGVLGVKVDGADEINEVDEENNFQFLTHEVVGTRVAVVFQGCDFGLTTPGGPGCDLTLSDGLFSMTLHRPCSNCLAREVLLPNELHPRVFATLLIRGCDRSQVPSGSCGGSWTIEGETQKPGLPVNKTSYLLACRANYPNTSQGCTADVEIRDPAY